MKSYCTDVYPLYVQQQDAVQNRQKRHLKKAGIMQKLQLADPGNDYLVPWGWSYVSVGINTKAVAKALGTGIGAVGWKNIEVQRGVNGEPHLNLVEKAAEEAQAQGLQTWSVSISHSKGLAVAVVVAAGEK